MIAARAFPFVGGIETHIHEVATRLAARGHAVEVLTTDVTRSLPPTETDQGAKIARVRAWPRGRDYHWAPGILSHVARGDWDVIHIQGYHTFSAPLGMIAALRKRTPFVLTFHSGGHSSGLRNSIRRLQHALLAPLAARAARLIGVSEFEADFFSERLGLPRAAFSVVPNGARLPGAGSRPVADSERPLILSVGRLERYKGHHRVIEAFRDLLVAIPGARLRVLGEGPYKEELLRLSARLGLRDRVEIGGIPASEREALADLMRGAALVVLMSEYEAHPVAVMEALSLQVPVLTSDTSGFRELARSGMVRAVPIDSGSADIAAAMEREIRSPRPPRPVELPDWDACADRLEAIYEEVARANAGAISYPRTRAVAASPNRALGAVDHGG
jgi:glycosyltransferase involved in cell wall biosynthesis